MATPPQEIDGFSLLPPSPEGRWTWPVYGSGTGRPVVVLHELIGLTPHVVAFARRLVDAGFMVRLPVLAGPAPSVGRADELRTVARVCISREFHILLGGRTSPVVEPLRALAQAAATEAGTPGVGVIGMCMTGGFALALAADDAVLAAVAAQPSLPFPVTPWCARDLGMSAGDVDRARARMRAGGVEVLYTRFTADPISPPARLAAARERLGPDGLLVDELPSGRGNPFGFTRADHSVLNAARRVPGRTEEGSRRLEESLQGVIAFLDGRLAGPAIG